MDNLNDLQAFFRTAELGSFVAAANSLGLTASAVGKSVARLEAQVGVRLLHRSTRRMQLTDEGRLLHTHCARLLRELDDARTMMLRMREAPRGTLRISAPIVAHHFLVPLIPGFLARYPEVEIDIDFRDRPADLIAAGIDLAIRSTTLADSSLVARPLQAFVLRLWASPEYIERRGVPQSLDDLRGHTAVRFRHSDSGALLAWPLLAGDALPEPPARTLLAFNNIEAVLSATLRGVGIACMPDFWCGTRMRRSGCGRCSKTWWARTAATRRCGRRAGTWRRKCAPSSITSARGWPAAGTREQTAVDVAAHGWRLAADPVLAAICRARRLIVDDAAHHISVGEAGTPRT